jgi:hypothetical protein
MCPLENQSSAKDLQQSLVQKSNEYKLAYIGFIEQYIKNRREKQIQRTEHTREIRERKENIFYINPSFSSLYFHIIQNL